MGFFNIFSSKKPSKKFNQIALEFKSLDFQELLEMSSFYEKHQNEGKFNSISYETILNKPFLNSFNKIRLRVSSTEKEFDKLKMVTFVSDYNVTIDEIANLVKLFTNLFEIYDDDFTEVDVMRIESGEWRGRSYLLDLGLVMIEFDKLGHLNFSVAGFQNFIEYLDNIS